MSLPFLVGSRYRRDHLLGWSVTKAEYILYGGPEGIGTLGLGTIPNDVRPVTLSLEQMLAITVRVRKWHFTSSGTGGSLSADIIYAPNTHHRNMISKAVSLSLYRDTGQLGELSGNAQAYLANWVVRKPIPHDDEYLHLPFHFLVHDNPLDGTTGTGDGHIQAFGFLTAFNVFDPTTKRFYPSIQIVVGKGVGITAQALRTTSTGTDGLLTVNPVVAPIFTVPLTGSIAHVGGPISGPGTMTLTATEFW